MKNEILSAPSGKLCPGLRPSQKNAAFFGVVGTEESRVNSNGKHYQSDNLVGVRVNWSILSSYQ
jgi:hypothetical protein